MLRLVHYVSLQVTTNALSITQAAGIADERMQLSFLHYVSKQTLDILKIIIGAIVGQFSHFLCNIFKKMLHTQLTTVKISTSP